VSARDGCYCHSSARRLLQPSSAVLARSMSRTVCELSVSARLGHRYIVASRLGSGQGSACGDQFSEKDDGSLARRTGFDMRDGMDRSVERSAARG
jgi:hypothetical protein